SSRPRRSSRPRPRETRQAERRRSFAAEPIHAVGRSALPRPPPVASLRRQETAGPNRHAVRPEARSAGREYSAPEGASARPDRSNADQAHNRRQKNPQSPEDRAVAEPAYTTAAILAQKRRATDRQVESYNTEGFRQAGHGPERPPHAPNPIARRRTYR